MSDSSVTATVKWAEHGCYDLSCSGHGPLGLYPSQLASQFEWVRHVKTEHAGGIEVRRD